MRAQILWCLHQVDVVKDGDEEVDFCGIARQSAEMLGGIPGIPSEEVVLGRCSGCRAALSAGNLWNFRRCLSE